MGCAMDVVDRKNNLEGSKRDKMDTEGSLGSEKVLFKDLEIMTFIDSYVSQDRIFLSIFLLHLKNEKLS